MRKAATLATAVRAVRKTCESPERCSSICRSIGANQLISQTSMEQSLWAGPTVEDAMHSRHSVTLPRNPASGRATAGVSPAPRYALGTAVFGLCYEADDWSD